jgi:hypothetical protein
MSLLSAGSISLDSTFKLNFLDSLLCNFKICLTDCMNFVSCKNVIELSSFNPHQNDQGQKGPCCFQRLIALKCLKCPKILKKYLFLVF